MQALPPLLDRDGQPTGCCWPSLVSLLLCLLLSPGLCVLVSFQSSCLVSTPFLHHWLQPLGKINISSCQACGVLTPPPPRQAVLKGLRFQGIISLPGSPFCCQIPPLCPLSCFITPGSETAPTGKVGQVGQEADGRPTQSWTSSGRHRSINTSLVLAAEGTRGAHLQPLLRTPINTHGLLSPRGRLCTALLPPPPSSPSPSAPACTSHSSRHQSLSCSNTLTTGSHSGSLSISSFICEMGSVRDFLSGPGVRVDSCAVGTVTPSLTILGCHHTQLFPR